MWDSISFILYLLMYKANATFNLYGSTTASYYSSCIIQLMGNFFDKPGHLIFANSYDMTTTIESVRTDLLHHINENCNFSVQIIKAVKGTTTCTFHNSEEGIGILHTNLFFEFKADYFITLSKDYKEFTHLASEITNAASWNAKAKFIIVILNFYPANTAKTTDVEKIMDCMFHLNVFNVAVIVPEFENVRNLIIYSYKPLDPPHFCGFLSEWSTNKIIVRNVCKVGMMENKIDIYRNTIPSNLEGCSLQILALERQPFVSENDYDPNIEKHFIDEIANKHNLKTKYAILKMHRGERNQEWNGALKELSLRKGHILLGGIFPDYDVHEDFECSTTYLEDSYAWVVPRAHPSPRWLALAVMFEKYVWLSAIAVFSLCVLTWRVLGQLSGDSYYHANIWHCLLNTWVSTLGFPAYVRPVKNSLRTFFAFFSIFCLILVTAYQAKLIDMLRYIAFDDEIETVEDLIASGLKFGGPEELHDLFYNSNGPMDIHIQRQWIDVKNVTKALIDVTVHRNFSVLCSRLELSYLTSIIPELRDDLGYDRYFAFKQNTFTVPMEMIAMKGFPFLEKISETLSLLKQIGVSKRLQKNLKTNLRKKTQALISSYIQNSKATPLSNKDLQGGFFVLALGILSGTVALFMEIVLGINCVKNKFLNKIIT